jgi:hypothetical protein
MVLGQQGPERHAQERASEDDSEYDPANGHGTHQESPLFFYEVREDANLLIRSPAMLAGDAAAGLLDKGKPYKASTIA